MLLLCSQQPLSKEISGEDELVLLLARGSLADHERGRALNLLQRNPRWNNILDRARAYNIYPLLYRNLRKLDIEAVPEEARRELKSLYQANLVRNLLLVRELTSLLTLFADRRIPAINLKGLPLAELLYGNIGNRVCVDLDLIVQQSHLEQALGALQGVGYAAEFSDGQTDDCRYYHIVLQRLDRGFLHSVELHWGILWGADYDRNAVESLWKTAEPSEVFGVPSYRLSPEWQVLYLSAHAANHLWDGLKWLVDIHETIHRAEFSWNRLEELAAENGLSHILSITAALCQKLFGTHLPEGFRPREIPSWVRVYPAPPYRHGWQLAAGRARLLPGTLDRIKVLSRYISAPSFAERRIVRLPAGLRFLYSPLRLVRLTHKWGSWLLRTFFRRAGQWLARRAYGIRDA